ncbi:HAD superfamily hydrolase (TIGR01509 family) [Clostridium tetanomorphum]|uniref:HAD family phosphatase n=1 Tax=Clostridium tetanomorphum TaxID=1553 RepID=A0A923EBY7_CLOTT|nr:HAD family phosphatase [Clostridium tetanomorphum]KAJ53227.1 phosphatase/phosphohexomutase [Clostridium tetanomorphum DSM 665]MBC2397533.1 HAD family phosphatase [Clostridium tetanomorphum]MBP1863629.1 HAD superfamily hydrolase (TIGR01509 family) [Clostridium tetanomorphum]NRS86205.1 HAD superfamily hydrolase (TIGR01509 family) [Clostridium tetanomorphum]NRZ95716.1 HAD superfamily hydrolase (TIGR01509 family) [Clostridium tetanomorphum]
MIKGVIFDMDGVMIDSEPIHFKLEQELFKELGIEISSHEHNTYVGTTSFYMWEKIKKNHNLYDGVEELVKRDRRKYLQFLSDNVDIEPIEGIVDLIKDLYKNGVKLAVASSSPIDIIELVVKRFNIREYFSYIVTGDYVANSKPDPDIFLYAAEKIKIVPDECLVVEDSYNGIMAAKRAGMKSVGYRNMNSGNQDLSQATFIIDSFNNISYDKIKNLT